MTICKIMCMYVGVFKQKKYRKIFIFAGVFLGNSAAILDQMWISIQCKLRNIDDERKLL